MENPLQDPQSAGDWPDLSFAADTRNISPDATAMQAQSNRGNNKASRVAGAYPRRRAIRACQVCRARRTKCDNKKPSCSFCERVGAKCVTSTSTDNSRFDPASLAILEQLDRIETLLGRPKITARGSRTDGSDDSSPVSEPRSTSSNLPRSPPLSRITIETVLSWAPFGSKFESGRNLKAVLDGSIYCGPNPTTSTDLGAQRLTFDYSVCIRLFHSFLEKVHIANPILDTAAVTEYVRRVCLHGPGWDASSCLVLLICALGSIAEAFQDVHGESSMIARRSPSFRIGQECFEAAQMRIAPLFHSHGIVEAQCFFYTGVYLMTVFQPMSAWRSFVQAAAISQAFDLSWAPWERDTDIGDGARNDQGSLKSTYWACLKSELEVRMELGLSMLSLQDLAYPTFFPSPPAEQLDNDAARVWYFYLAEIAVRRLAIRILNFFFEHQIDGRYLHVRSMVESSVEFEMQAAEWAASLPPVLSLETPEVDDDVLKFVLRGHLLDCYESIYFPFILEAINHQNQDVAVNHFAQKGLQVSVERIYKNRMGFKHRHHGVWLMLRSCTRSALVLLAARCCSGQQALVPAGWKEAVLSVMEMLSFWQDEAADARDRLRILTEIMNDIDGYT